MGEVLQHAPADQLRRGGDQSEGEAMILVPGFREMHQVMLDSVTARRGKVSKDELPRFDELTSFASSKLAEAQAIEHLAHTDAIARKLYKELCLSARVAMFATYDEPRAIGGERHRKVQRVKATQSRTHPEIDGIIKKLARRESSAKELWGGFVSMMNRAGIKASERGDAVIYETDEGSERRMSAATFANRLTRERKNISR